MGPSRDVQRYLDNWRGEIDSIYLYSALSRSEKNAELSRVYAKLAAVEDKHSKFWEKKIAEAGGTVPSRRPRLRPRVLAFLAARFGAQFVLPTVMNLENMDNTSYDTQPESKHTNLPGDERSHMRMLKAISQTSPKGMEGGALAKLEGRHRSIGGNALRAGVLGANDGLVSNLSLIMGVAGAELSGQTILVTGFAGLVAGAFSMAMGEWLSVQSSRELYERQIQVEAQELAEVPKEEEEELALIYEAKGLPKSEAEKLAKTLIADEKNALNTLSREELGIDPEELGGSAWEAAIMSFVLFAAGAVVPLAPFLFLSGQTAVIASACAGAGALFLTGALITLLTGRNVFYSGFRQMAIGLGAASVTFLIGRLVGIPIAG